MHKSVVFTPRCCLKMAPLLGECRLTTVAGLGGAFSQSRKNWLQLVRAVGVQDRRSGLCGRETGDRENAIWEMIMSLKRFLDIVM